VATRPYFAGAVSLELITAMEEAHVKRLICVTGFGAGDSRGHNGFLYGLGFHLLLGREQIDDDAFLYKAPVLTG
jgi:hypothetical protein